MDSVLVVGMGYVGMPLALAASDHFSVTGLDTNAKRIEELCEENDKFWSKERNTINGETSGNFIRLVNNASDIKEKFDYIIICVPTPINSFRKPNLEFVRAATVSILHLLTETTLVVLESSSYPGTTRNVVVPLIENYILEQKLREEMPMIAYSPERVDPANLTWNICNTPKVISGIDQKSRRRCRDFYEKFVEQVVEASSLEVAEAAKLFENTFRLVNISLVNELWQVLLRSGIDTREVLEVAYSKPFGIMPFSPGPGIGGHCIPVDPYYLTSWLAENSLEMSIVKAAQTQHEGMAKFITELINMQLESMSIPRSVVLCGISYKPGVPDSRESPAERIFDELVSCGITVRWYDKLILRWKDSECTQLKDFGKDLVVVLHNDPNLVNEVEGVTNNYMCIYP